MIGTRKMLMIVALLALIAGMPATGALAQDLVRVSAGPTDLDFQPAVTHARLVLTVSAPDGCVVRQEVKAGTPASFSLFDEDGLQRPDGSYTWEVALKPVVDKATRETLAGVRGTDREKKAVDELRRAGKLPRESLVQSGSFTIVDGAFVLAGDEEAASGKPRARLSASGATGGTERAAGSLERVGAADQVIPDDLIVQGSACVGLDCVNNENFGFDTIRLKENNLRIHFDDTSSQAGFPANDWRLVANDSASGGQSKFSIEDSTGARTPFTVEAGATTNSIYVDSTGRVGFRTSTPVLDLHVNTSNTPALRLEQNSSGGFTAQTWDVAGNEANFFVRDVTGGSLLPFRIRPGAPTSSVDISSDGDVGIGTGGPEADLHVFCSNTSDCFFALGPNPAGTPASEGAFNLGYGGTSFLAGGAFMNARADSSAVAPNPSIRFLTGDAQRMILDNQGFIGLNVPDPTSPIHHSSGAILTAGGAWQNGSSRAIKQDIANLAADEALATLQGLEPVKYAYKVDPNERHVGFIAEDVPNLVASPDRKSLSSLDIVAVLTKVVQEQQKTIDELTVRLDELEQQKK